ncbi:MAG: hypothetical protein ACLFVF_05165, partial [Thiohalospira sp.]
MLESPLAGEGTETNPYEIETAFDLQLMAEDLDANYTLVADVDANETADWNDGDGLEPVGDADDPFEGSLSGSFDGDGHEIENLTASVPDGDAGHAGLFGATKNASVSDVTLVDANVTAGTDGHAGALAGSQDGGTIADSTVTDSAVRTRGDTFSNKVGGLVGSATGTLTGVEATGVIETEDETLGGVVGVLDEGSAVSDVSLDDLDLDVGDGGSVDGAGLLSASGEDDVTLEDVSIPTDLTLDVEEIEYLGGLVGDAGTADDWRVDDADVSGDLNMQANGSIAQTGLIAGEAGDGWNLTNADVSGAVDATAGGSIEAIGAVGEAGHDWRVADTELAGGVNAAAAEDV